MILPTLLLVAMILLLIGALPRWPYSRNWGFAPSGVLAAVVAVIIALAVAGRL